MQLTAEPSCQALASARFLGVFFIKIHIHLTRNHAVVQLAAAGSACAKVCFKFHVGCDHIQTAAGGLFPAITQIARQLGVNPSTVSRTLRRAQERLRRYLQYAL